MKTLRKFLLLISLCGSLVQASTENVRMPQTYKTSIAALAKTENPQAADRKTCQSTHILLSDKSTIDAALSYSGKRVAVVNFANAYAPGGAQEGSLRIATTLDDELQKMVDQEQYPLSGEELFISKNVRILQDGNSAVLCSEKKTSIDVISIAAVDLRGGHMDEATYRDVMKKKIEAQILAATLLKAEVLVAGAFGCGIFGGEPHAVAQLYKEAIDQYGCEIKEVHFAIYRGGPNLEAFQKVFGGWEE